MNEYGPLYLSPISRWILLWQERQRDIRFEVLWLPPQDMGRM